MPFQVENLVNHLLFAVLFSYTVIAGENVAVAQKAPDLQKIEGELASGQARQRELERQSRIISTEMTSLREQMISAATAVQSQEAHMTRIEDKLRVLSKEADDRRKRLNLSNKQMQATLIAIEKLSRNPPEALFLMPGKPIDVVRSATLLRAAVPRLHKRARGLKKEVNELESIQTEMFSQFEKMATATQALENERRKMRALVIRKESLRRLTNVEKARITKRIAKLTAQAQSLRDLFSSLRNKRKGDTNPRQRLTKPGLKFPVSIRSFPKTGGVRLPARGAVVKSYGQPIGRGNTAKGITIAARAGAQVIAPFDGKIVFTGPFRGYGKIVIIEHRGGYHTLLAGLEKLYNSLGQWLLAGEPIGAMAAASRQKTMLYLELRQKGQPVNPLPWVAYKTLHRRNQG